MGRNLKLRQPCYYRLTLGTGVLLHPQVIPPISSTSYPNMGDCKGWIELSPPVAYPSTMEYEANEGKPLA